MPQSDEKLQCILARAAVEPGFRDALLRDRASALAEEDLSESERLLLLSAPEEQLRKMIEAAASSARKRPAVGLGVRILVGVGAAAVLGGLLLPTLGHSREAAAEVHALSALKQIRAIHEQYKADHGVYASLADLRQLQEVRQLVEECAQRDDYMIEIESGGDNFAATARNKTRPKTRRVWRIGPDGEVTTGRDG